MDNNSDSAEGYTIPANFTYHSCTWKTNASGNCFHNNASLGAAASGVQVYDYGNNAAFVWPTITSQRYGAMDADADGVDDGNPAEL